jgi:SDR family mycofactocin-dependent oxidoreductase
VGRLEGKVALVSGGARGQGRSHALRLAEEGADIITLDLCEQVDTVNFAMSTPADLEETVRQIEALDRRIVAEICDVRDRAALEGVVNRGVEELGRLDVVAANAGIAGVQTLADGTDDQWQNMIDINLTGVWNTLKAAVPAILAGGEGGSIILTSSYAGHNGVPNVAPYSAAKHGVIGLMRSLANELGPQQIRVNSISPGNVGTDMLLNDEIFRVFRPDLDAPGLGDVEDILLSLPTIPVPYVEAVDISNALVFLASDEARYITGFNLPVDAGWAVK